MGSLQRLPRLVGLSRARELALTARVFNGDEARTIGLVAETVPSSTLTRRAFALAGSIASKPAIAARGTKSVINARFGSSSTAKQSLEANAMLNAATMISNDLEEKLRGLKPRM